MRNVTFYLNDNRDHKIELQLSDKALRCAALIELDTDYDLIKHYKEEMECFYTSGKSYEKTKRLYETEIEKRIREDSWYVLQEAYYDGSISEEYFFSACNEIKAMFN